MLRIEYLILGIFTGGVLLPFVTFAQTKVPMSTENYFYTNFLPKTGCTLEKEGSRDEVTKQKTIPVDVNRAHQALVYFEFAKSSVSTYVVGTGITAGYDVINYLRSSKSGFYTCSAESFNQIIAESKTLNFVEKIGIWLISWTTWVINSLAEWLLGFLADLILAMLRQNTYINQDFVKQGWVFIQGITNLGFVFVLLYIALATTLRIESIGTSIQRLLPKLLIGALLVNFSLIIGGFFIDASRLLMAIELNVLSQDKNDHGKTSIEALKDGLFSKSRLLEADIAKYKYQGASGAYMASIIRLVQGSVFRIVLLLAFGVIALNLLVRYITLLILLIFSPIPYLAFILPKTTKAASIWWGYFLRWVFYGPTILFFLVLIINIQNIDVAIDSRNDGTWMDSVAFKEFVRFIIVMSLFFVGNKLSKKIAGDVGDLVMSGAKRTGNFIRNNPKTAMIAAGAATGGLGFLAGAAGAAAGIGVGQAGARGAANLGRDFSDKFKKDFAKRARSGDNYLGIPATGKLASIIAGPERDDKGKLKKGETSVGSSTAKFIGKKFGLGDPKQRKQTDEIKRELARTPLATPAMASINIPTNLQQFINGAGLSQGHIAKALDDGTKPLDTSSTLRFIIEHNDNKGTVGGLAQNEDFLRDIGPDGRNEFIKILNTNIKLNPNDKADIVNRMVRTVKDKDI